jgi:hypothetical protein
MSIEFFRSLLGPARLFKPSVTKFVIAPASVEGEIHGMPTDIGSSDFLSRARRLVNTIAVARIDVAPVLETPLWNLPINGYSAIWISPILPQAAERANLGFVRTLLACIHQNVVTRSACNANTRATWTADTTFRR